MRERNIPWLWTMSIRIGVPPNQMNIGSARRHFRVHRRNISPEAWFDPLNWPVFHRHLAGCHQVPPLKVGASMPKYSP
jgi:hypothetical protein